MVAGLIPSVAGMTWLGQLSASSTYVSGVLGPMLLLGVGMGIVFVPLTLTSLAGVAPEDSGAASSMVNVTQQVGGALGLAILVTVFGTASRSAARHPLAHAGPVAQAHHVLIHGMSSAFMVSAAFDLCAFILVALLIRMKGPAEAAPAAGAVQPERESAADRELLAEAELETELDLAEGPA